MSGLARRLTVGLVGQGFWRIAAALNTILLVPVLIANWGVDGYGQWMTINAIVGYLAFANLGLVATASNELIMAVAAQDHARAQKIFQMSCNLAIGPFPAILVGALVVAALLPLDHWFNLQQFSKGSLIAVLGLGALQLCFETFRGLMAAVLYSAGRYGLAYNIAAGAKLIELGTAMFAVGALGAHPVHVATIMAGVALLDLAIIVRLARSAAPWARLNFRMFDGQLVRAQLKPALGFSCYNFAVQGVLTLGPRLVLGALLGGPAVAVYAVYATAMRLVDQLFMTLMGPIGVEISHAAGRGQSGQVVRLIAIVGQLSSVVFLAVALFLELLGPIIFEWWTHSRIVFAHGMMALYLVMSAASLPGRIAAQVLISMNAMRVTALVALLLALTSILLAAVLVPNLDISGALIAGIGGEIAISFALLISLKWRFALALGDLGRDVLDFSNSFAEIRTHARAAIVRRKD